MAALKRVAKRELRQQIKKILSEVSTDAAATQTSTALRTLFSMPEYQAAKRISIYLSMPSGEISTDGIVRDALRSGKKVFIPYTYKLTEPQENKPNSIMDMLELHSFDDYESFKPDKWGIPTPSESSVASRANSMGGQGLSNGNLNLQGEPEGLDFIVMPGMAFDAGYGRLGHGKGFYDFFLERYHQQQTKKPTAKMPILVGLALKEQLLDSSESVPMDETDWRLDALVVGDGRLLYSKST